MFFRASMNACRGAFTSGLGQGQMSHGKISQGVNRLGTKSLFSASRMSAARDFRAAVVFHGNGVYDGTETTEAVSLLVGLSRLGAEVQVFAPNRDQAHVVNHLTGEEQQQTRNVMEESSRISRGDCKALSDLKAQDFDALLIPGGFGAAKNLCDFGFKGADMTVQADIEKVLKDFHSMNKVIGLTCIAPVIAAKVFG